MYRYLQRPEENKIFLKGIIKLFKVIQCPQKNFKGKPYPDQITMLSKN